MLVKATFEKITLAQVRKIIPAQEPLPNWSTFTVNIEITDRYRTISLFDRYHFNVTTKEALAAITTLTDLTEWE